MKKLIALSALILLPLAVRAQTTNITVALTVEEGTTRTNTVTFALSQLQVIGIHVGYESSLVSNGTNAPTFRGFTRQITRDLLTPLKESGQAYQMSTAKVNRITESIQANWEAATVADRKLLLDWLAKYPVSP